MDGRMKAMRLPIGRSGCAGAGKACRAGALMQYSWHQSGCSPSVCVGRPAQPSLALLLRQSIKDRVGLVEATALRAKNTAALSKSKEALLRADLDSTRSALATARTRLR